ncbi:energy transducer TonB [Flagellatimonas centrodinii]|uniref:TonB family protein n=1 Tax=Flagellatimonas centrodinii TaxID=2806210 RepID=UPI001FF7B3BC|nr:TonB family protein [Flagellatimonas centrodinii]ULQ45670.1 energy transducer TonB [Flagellatimonas centrodinii]
MQPFPADPALEGAPWPRLALTVVFAVAVAVLLFLWMHWMTRAPEAPPDAGRRLQGVELVKVKEEPDPPPEALFSPEAEPPPPPAAPPALSAPQRPSVNVPTLAINAAEVGNIAVPLNSGTATGVGLASSGAFAGFAGQGSGAGGGGDGSGRGFTGKPLVPLSTARPQMPKWACDKGIRGWVEVVFTVMPNGRVQNVKLINADPRGVFEAAAIESISNWIYEQTDRAREVKQRVPMNPEDCAYNWQ